MPSRFLLVLLVGSLLGLSGCGTGGAHRYQGPSTVAWNVTIESTPPGAEVSWQKHTQNNDGPRHPIGKAPVTASIPLEISPDGIFYDVQIFVKAGRATGIVETTRLLKGYAGPTLTGHPVAEAAKLPSRITVNPYEDYAYDIVGHVEMIRAYEKDPDYWRGFVTSMQGKVTSIQESTQGSVIQLWVERQKNVVVFWPSGRMPGVVEGTELKVLGNVSGRTSGTNAFGGTVNALTFQCFGYIADWYRTTPTTNFLPERKGVFDKWAEGTLFSEERVVRVE